MSERKTKSPQNPVLQHYSGAWHRKYRGSVAPDIQISSIHIQECYGCQENVEKY